MAINYTWDCKTVDVKTIDGNEDTIFNVHWRLTGTDDTNTVSDGFDGTVNASATVYGTQDLDTSDLSSFIALTDLTASDVQGWVESAMGEDKVTELKNGLAGSISKLVTPTQETKTIGE